MNLTETYQGRGIEQEVLCELLSLDYRLRINESFIEDMDVSKFTLKTEILYEEYADCDWYIKQERGALFYKDQAIALVEMKDEEGHVDVELTITNSDIIEEICIQFYTSLLKKKLGK